MDESDCLFFIGRLDDIFDGLDVRYRKMGDGVCVAATSHRHPVYIGGINHGGVGEMDAQTASGETGGLGMDGRRRIFSDDVRDGVHLSRTAHGDSGGNGDFNFCQSIARHRLRNGFPESPLPAATMDRRAIRFRRSLHHDGRALGISGRHDVRTAVRRHMGNCHIAYENKRASV